MKRCGLFDPKCLPSAGTIAPFTSAHAPLTTRARRAASSRTSGSGLPRSRDLAATIRLPAPFRPPCASCESDCGLASRSRPPMPSGARFYEPRCRLPISATLTTRGHAYERSILARQVGRSPLCLRVLSRERECVCRTDGLPRSVSSEPRHPDKACAPQPLARPRDAMGRGARAKEHAPLERRSLLTSSSSTRVTDPNRQKARSLLPPLSCRPRSPSDAAPRRATPPEGPRCLRPSRNSYASVG